MLLLDAGADPNGQCYGLTALMLALKNNRLEIALVLLEAGADVAVRIGWFKTALSLACYNKP